MLKTTQFNALNTQVQGLFDTYVNLTSLSIDNFKQAMGIQCDAFNHITKQFADTAKSLCGATDAGQAGKFVQEFFAKTIETSIEKNKELSNVFSKSQNVFKDAAIASFKEVQTNYVNTFEQFPMVNTALSKAATESIQNSITTFNQAADTASKVSAQVAEVAKKNIEVATNVALNAAKKATVTSNLAATK